MHIILLSGGSGQRLWPLSNDSRSKQFLKLLENEETGQLESMYQRTCRMLKRIGLKDNIVIAANIAQKDMLENQKIIDAPFVFESERRDTFPAIALANSYLKDVVGIDDEEIVVVCPIDTYANLSYYESIKKLANVFAQSNAKLGLLGVKPTYPSTKYGYILRGIKEQMLEYSNASSFIEKPSELKAAELIDQDALWNCGVFAFRTKYLYEVLENMQINEINYDWIKANYAQLEKISFDYAVVEKTSNIIVVEYDGEWRDLGTWNTLTDEIHTEVIGKGQLSTDCTQTHIINELKIPVAGLALHNLVVVASPDGILVADKTQSHRLKEFTSFVSDRPMYEERRWGYYRVLDYTNQKDGTQTLTKRLTIEKGKNISYQKHFKRSEIWTVISGKAEFVINDVLKIVYPGDVLKINVGDKHGIRAIEDTEIIEVQMGRELIEEDITRLEFDWDRLIQHLN